MTDVWELLRRAREVADNASTYILAVPPSYWWPERDRHLSSIDAMVRDINAALAEHERTPKGERLYTVEEMRALFLTAIGVAESRVEREREEEKKR